MSPHRQIQFVVSLAVLAGALAGAPAIVVAQTTPTTVEVAPVAPAVHVDPIDVSDVKAIVKKWGIQIESLRLTASGYMLDFRYRVIDARKAKPLFQRKTKPVLKDEATGAIMAVPTPPKTGALRNSYDPKAGRSYFMFFANPAHFIKAGNKVTVIIGAFAVSGIHVGTDTDAIRGTGQ